MNQISATFIKGLKDNLMSISALFWVIAWPIIWLLLGVFVFMKGVPEAYLGLAKGQTTLSMVTFSFMIAGMTSLAATISEDIGTVQEVIEPYLMQKGLLKRTKKGRMATQKAFRHLNLPLPKGKQGPLF